MPSRLEVDHKALLNVKNEVLIEYLSGDIDILVGRLFKTHVGYDAASYAESRTNKP